MSQRPTKLTDVTKAKSWVVIIRCIHERGTNQQEALAELAARGLWLSFSQREQAGLPPVESTKP